MHTTPQVRGVPALSYFGGVVWKDAFERMNEGEGLDTATVLPQGNARLQGTLQGGCHKHCAAMRAYGVTSCTAHSVILPAAAAWHTQGCAAASGTHGALRLHESASCITH